LIKNNFPHLELLNHQRTATAANSRRKRL